MISLLAVGADPEFFLADWMGRPITAIGKIGGTKAEPRYISDDGHSAVQEDNVMVEYNIKPATDSQEFINNHKFVLTYLHKYLKQRSLTPVFYPSMAFSTKQLRTKQAKYMGCEPDFNAWTGTQNEPVSVEKFGRMRTAGGHVHMSYRCDGELSDYYEKVVYACDLMLGVPSIILDHDTTRRVFYGKAGAFRPKKYGIEYRVLSNFWIRTPHLMKWVYDQCVNAIEIVNEGVDLTKDRSDILGAIDDNNINLANHLIRKFNIRLPLYAI